MSFEKAKYEATILFLLFLPGKSLSQELKLTEFITTFAEELAENESDPEASTIFMERLNDLADDPVRLNSGDNNELARLFFLSDFQIKSLSDYTETAGEIVSPFEIVNIPGFDRETVMMMIPFISLEKRTASLYNSAVFRSNLLSNYSVRSGFDTASAGSPCKILVKYQFRSGNISGGITSEKDQGEKLLSGSPPLPDFLSANLSFSGNGLIRKLIIGDFSARFGQGTNINTGIRTGLSLTIPGNMSGRDEIKPYTSTSENNFFRGVATQLQAGNLSFSLFYSVNKTDGTITETDNQEFIENLNTTGLHDSDESIIKKDNINERSYAANLAWSFENIKTGLILSGTSFSLPFVNRGGNPENVFDYHGDRNYIGTFYYNTLIKRIVLFGEVSSDERKNLAVIQGFNFRPVDRLSISFLYRNYQTGFTAFHDNGPGSNSSGDNLEGILGSFTFEAAKYLFVSAGYDFQNFPWLKYRCSSPSHSEKGEVRIRFLPGEKFSSDVSYYYRLGMYDEAEGSGIIKQKELKSRALKVSVKYSPIDGLTFGNRCDLKIADSNESKGALLYQDINYKFSNLPLNIWFRYCIFHTDDWDSRLYTWENDLLYSFSIPALSGEGSRYYLVAGWKIWNSAELRLKYGCTALKRELENTNNIHELKIQFRARF